LITEPAFLNEPAIISSSATIPNNEDLDEPKYIAAKIKPFGKEQWANELIKSPNQAPSRDTDSEINIDEVLADPDQREDLVEMLTETIFESLVKECVAQP